MKSIKDFLYFACIVKRVKTGCNSSEFRGKYDNYNTKPFWLTVHIVDSQCMNSKVENYSKWSKFYERIIQIRQKEVPASTWIEIDYKNSYTSSNTAYHYTICPGLFAVAIGCGITSKDYNEKYCKQSFFLYIYNALYVFCNLDKKKKITTSH